jgi:hypothetical protein
VLIYTPPFQALLGTAALSADMLLFAAPFSFIVWGSDELRRWLVRHRHVRQRTRARRPQPRQPIVRFPRVAQPARDDVGGPRTSSSAPDRALLALGQARRMDRVSG